MRSTQECKSSQEVNVFSPTVTSWTMCASYIEQIRKKTCFPSSFTKLITVHKCSRHCSHVCVCISTLWLCCKTRQAEVEQDVGGVGGGWGAVVIFIIQMVLLGVFTWCMQMKAVKWGRRPPTNLIHHQIIITLIRIAALWEKREEGSDIPARPSDVCRSHAGKHGAKSNGTHLNNFHKKVFLLFWLVNTADGGERYVAPEHVIARDGRKITERAARNVVDSF